ncbi:MAG: D-tyrosyl-tRNA(Tyr) deacylase [Phycisphaerales bacterium]|nr:D-tyrosyl-tRNA(Tyr) deacylase [Phycisphaerales bacterium]
MRAVVQRVSRARVTVADEEVGAIGPGLLVYAAAAPDDGANDVRYIADKVGQLRIFPDAAYKLNRSVLDAGGAVLLVSAFTVQADARRGRRPSFDSSAPGEVAEPLIERLVAALRGMGLEVATGRFGAQMRVESANEGPICVLLDSKRGF